MKLSTSEAASAFGVSEQRVRAMIASGSLEATRVGGRWLIDEVTFEASRRSGRAMTAANAWKFLDLSSGREVDARPEERWRMRQRLARLFESENPALLLRTWLANRATRVEYEVGDASPLERDERVMPSGLSDTASGLARRGDESEGYVVVSQLRAVELDNAIFRTGRGEGNVVLHVVQDAFRAHLHASLLLTAADLAEHNDARSRSQADRLVRELHDLEGGQHG